jgi:GH24 family phage-related lysozyme (muramidase)
MQGFGRRWCRKAVADAAADAEAHRFLLSFLFIRSVTMRQITPQGIALVQLFEGFSPVAYDCPGGYQTIGYGHVILPDEDFSDGITKQWAEELLKRDLRLAEAALRRLIAVPLSDGQFDALVSFTFNLGAGALQRSTLRRKVNAGMHDDVPRELLRWVYAGGQKLAGLIRRREAEGLRYRAAV